MSDRSAMPRLGNPRLVALLMTAIALCGCVDGAVSAAAEPRKKVLVIGIDGLRPDALLAAEAPHLRKLIESGAFTDTTQILGPRPTESDTISGPGWSSILCGVWSDKHRVLDNEFTRTDYAAYPHFFARLKESRPGATTLSVVNWPPIHEKITSAADIDLLPAHADDKDYAGWDEKVAVAAAQGLYERDVDAAFVYFGNVDVSGHAEGFHPSVPRYMDAIAAVDRHVGELLAALRQRPHYADEDWLIIVCTDHGGQGTNHGGGHDVPEIRTVFLIVGGQSAQPGRIEGETYLVDVVPTALAHLGVVPREEWGLDGRAVGLRPRE